MPNARMELTNAAAGNCYGLREDSLQKNRENRRDCNTPLPSMRRRCARQALFREFVEIFSPVFFAILTEFEKILPTKDSGRMHVVEIEPHRIIADLVDLEDLHILLAGDGAPFARRVALDLGARAAHPQIFG